MAKSKSKRFNSDLEGCQVLLRMSAGDVEGIVHTVSPDSARLSLIKAIDLDSGVQVPGILHFYSSDIASCVVLDNTSRKKPDTVKDEDGPSLLRTRPLPAHLERLNASKSGEFICHRMEGDDSEEVKKGNIELTGPPDMLPKLQKPLPAEFEVIDQVNDRFQKAMAAVKASRSVSIGFEGPKVSRHGSISVLAVATSMKVFIFDVVNLKEALFDRGLREVLESNDTEKVIHGCRHLSDCLHHRYKVTLNNVFDTMVADVVIYYGRKTDAGHHHRFPEFVRGLQNCLRGFLGLTEEQLKYTRSRQGHQEELMSSWEQRPLTLAQIDALVKDTVYLAELSRACLKQLLLRFHLGVQFFLGLERNCSAKELDCLPPDHILPAGFKDALRCGTLLSVPHRHYESYDQDCKREYGRYNRKYENNRYQHRDQHQDHHRRDNNCYQRDQDRSGYANPRGVRRQGDAMHGQRDGFRNDLLGEASQVDDSLMFVAMRHQGGNLDDHFEDAAARVPVMANGRASCGPHGAMNGHGTTNDLSVASRSIDLAGESSDESEHESPVCIGHRTVENNDAGTDDKGNVEPTDVRKFAGMSSAVPGAAVKETSTAAVGGDSLLIMGAGRGKETLRTPLRECPTVSSGASVDANQKSPGLSPSGWGARPTDNKYNAMSFRPADMQVQKYSG